MSNPETTLVWHPLRDRLDALRSHCLSLGTVPPHWDRIESVVGSGIPDLNWSWNGKEGWIELKHRSSPPVNPETPVVIESINPHQRLFWRQRWESGGSVFVLVRIGMEWMLFSGYWAAFNLGKCDMQSLRDHATWLCDSPKDLDAAHILRNATRGS